MANSSLKCPKCHYKSKLAGNVICDYMDKTGGHSRPGPPGDNCTVFITEEEYQRMARVTINYATAMELYKLGMSDKEMGEKLGVTAGAVWAWRNNNKLPLNPKKAQNKEAGTTVKTLEEENNPTAAAAAPPLEVEAESDTVNEEPVNVIKEAESVNKEPESVVKEAESVNDEPESVVKEAESVNDELENVVKEAESVNAQRSQDKLVIFEGTDDEINYLLNKMKLYNAEGFYLNLLYIGSSEEFAQKLYNKDKLIEKEVAPGMVNPYPATEAEPAVAAVLTDRDKLDCTIDKLKKIKELLSDIQGLYSSIFK